MSKTKRTTLARRPKSQTEPPGEVALDLHISPTEINNQIADWIAANESNFAVGTSGAIEREALYRILWTPYEVQTIAGACARVVACFELLRDPSNSISWLFDSAEGKVRS